MTFLIPLIGMIAGILVGGMIRGPIWGAIPILLGLASYFIILRKSRLPFSSARLNSKHSVWIFLLFSGVGILTSWFHRPLEYEEGALPQNAAAFGEIKESTTAASGDAFLVEVSKLFYDNGTSDDCRNLKILLRTDGYSASPGDLILFPCSLSPITDNDNRRSPGYSELMRRKGIIYTSYAIGDRIISKGEATSLLVKSHRIKDNIAIALEKSSLNRETSEFLISILLGDRSLLSKDVKETFSNAGVAHILALSGMHVAIVMGIIMFLLYPLKVMGLHKSRYAVATLLVWGYALVTGLAPSTVRACVMTTFLILAMSLQRKNASSNSLLASAFIILLLNPYAIFDVGMQLSFLCVGSILLFAGPLNTVSRHAHPRLHAINTSILVSLIATLSTWVLVSYYFKRIPVLFLPANMILLPLLPVYLSLALAYTAILLLGYDPHIIAILLDKGYSAFTYIAEWLSSFGNATVDFKANLPIVVAWLLGVLVMGYAMKKKRKLAATVTALSLFAGSFAMIPFMAQSQPDGMIFQKRYSDISMALYNADKESLLSFPRNAVSKIDFLDNEIFSIDCMSQLDSMAEMIVRNRSGKRKYLILGSGYKNKLRDIPGIKDFERIILHPSLRKKKEKELINEAMDYGLRQVHSLRHDGPLEVEMASCHTGS